jgi:3-phenylpropionate/cinnamic acid dioxygenase small subunit
MQLPVQPRENHERNLPLATLSFVSRGMLEDRVYGIQETLFHDPYYQRHVVGLPVVHSVDADGAVHSEANYAVFRTKLDGNHRVQCRPLHRQDRAHARRPEVRFAPVRVRQ